MLQKPDLADEQVIGCLRAEFNLPIAQLSFLPLGADLDTAVYRAETGGGHAFFVKLRSGAFDANAVQVPAFLAAQGIPEIIPPLPTRDGALWATLESFRVIVYPFVQGQNGFEVKLSASQWKTFGAALAHIHAVKIPEEFSVARETFTPRWRSAVNAYMKRADASTFDEPLARELAAFMRSRHAEIIELVTRAQQLANALQTQAPGFVLCHSDIHAGNLLVAANGALFLVDWDTLQFAPRERDLMFIGGAQGFAGYSPQAEVEMFYRGYGEIPIHTGAFAYYRYERIVEDLAVECEQIFSASGSVEDRAQALQWFQSNFLPGATLEHARDADRQ